VARSQVVGTALAIVVLTLTSGVGIAMDEGGAPAPPEQTSPMAPTQPRADPASLPGLPLLLLPGPVVMVGLLARRRRTSADAHGSRRLLQDLHRSTLKRRAALRTPEPGLP
jgi:hypothetical protein